MNLSSRSLYTCIIQFENLSDVMDEVACGDENSDVIENGFQHETEIKKKTEQNRKYLILTANSTISGQSRSFVSDVMSPLVNIRIV